MDHNIGVILRDLLRVLLFTIRISLIHFHIIIATFLDLLFLLIFALAVLNVDLLTASFLVFLGRGSRCVFGTSHVGIFTLGRYAFSLGLSFCLLLFFFVGAVLIAVCDEVGFGLVRRELWGSRLLGIPSAVSS